MSLDHAAMPVLFLERIEPNDIREFTASLQSRETIYLDRDHRKPIPRRLSPFTVHGYVCTLAAFFHWAIRERVCSRQ